MQFSVNQSFQTNCNFPSRAAPFFCIYPIPQSADAKAGRQECTYVRYHPSTLADRDLADLEQKLVANELNKTSKQATPTPHRHDGAFFWGGFLVLGRDPCSMGACKDTSFPFFFGFVS